MIPVHDIQLYLPKYLSEANYKTLLKELKSFPDNIDQRMYTTSLEKDVLYQGDGFDSLPYMDMMNIDKGKKEHYSIILSNTCDIDQDNKRLYPSSIMYAPIIDLEKYIGILREQGVNEGIIVNHLRDIRKQSITSILYLPNNERITESIVFLDRIMNIGNDYIKRDTLLHNRLFSLSDYGFYLLLFKISVHFSRIQEKVNRGHCE